LKLVPKLDIGFHKLQITENTVGVLTIAYIYKKYLGIYPKAYCALVFENVLPTG